MAIFLICQAAHSSTRGRRIELNNTDSIRPPRSSRKAKKISSQAERIAAAVKVIFDLSTRLEKKAQVMPARISTTAEIR